VSAYREVPRHLLPNAKAPRASLWRRAWFVLRGGMNKLQKRADRQEIFQIIRFNEITYPAKRRAWEAAGRKGPPPLPLALPPTPVWK
jgi:hypothetical protein